MNNILIVELLLILGGLGIVWLSKGIGGMLGRVFFWVGLIVAVIGVILLVVPVLVWIRAQLVSMLGAG